MANTSYAAEHPTQNAVFRSLNALAPQIRRVLIGLFLIAAFSATGAVLLFVLTAEQLQNAMAAPDLSTTKSTIGAIRQDVASVEYYYSQLDVISKKQKAVEDALGTADVDSRGALARMTSSADDVTTFINQNDTAYILPPLKLRPFAPPPGVSPPALAATGGSGPSAPPPATAQLEILDFDSVVTGYLATYYSELGEADASPQAETARKALTEFKTQIYASFEVYRKAHSEYDADTARLASLKAQESALDTRNKDLDEEIAPKGSALSNPAYWNLCEDFFSFKTLVGENAYHIVLLPKMMLVLTLAIFMGILGSLIYISQDFLKDPEGRGFWDILFRIGLGAGVAFALFFFAAAGMLAMTQSSAPSAQANMSPYLISFLGITGGYLSDRVTQWMREVGENTFKINPGGPPPRWAVGLDAALKSGGLTGAALAAATGATAAEVEDWIALKKPVPGEKQVLVSAFLRLHPSAIFTDIEPG
ncbi:MAG: hypothetical protein WDM91_01540 [Rhizomicrobium sp.]